MNEREMANKNMIVKMVCGSTAYGTSLPSSDVDYVGVFVANLEYYIGLHNVKEVDLSVISKNDDGKNNTDAVDFKLYEIRNFFKLAMDNNPNVLEMLFFSDKTNIETSLAWKWTKKNRGLFLSRQRIFDKFMGYAISQKHKMMLKPENYDSLLRFKSWYEDCVSVYGKDLAVEFKDVETTGMNFSKDFISVGDLRFNISVRVNKIYESVCERLSKATHRTDMYTKYGYDTKFAMHLIRLLMECEILLLTGNLELPFDEKTREFLIKIRMGTYSPDEIIRHSEKLENRCREAFEISRIQVQPNVFEVEKLLMKTIFSFHNLGIDKITPFR